MTSKSTKRALITSVLSILMCVAMLIGTTFAWFTDTASTGVNKIQAGNLDVQLLDANGNSLEGQTLAWQKAEGHESESVLWEPGCTYKLQPITIKNNGSLNLKYKIVISGIKGSAKLNEAIEWTITNSSSVSDLGADHPLAHGSSDTLTISGHMRKDAGNEYQGLSIDGIAITVVATQLGGSLNGVNGENDSFDNIYDQNATYPEAVVVVPAVNAVALTAEKNAAGQTIYKYSNPSGSVKVSVPTVAENQTATVSVAPTEAPTNSTVSAEVNNEGRAVVAYEISMTNANLSTGNLATFEILVGKDLTNVKLYHSDVAMTSVAAKADLDAADEFYYDAVTGFATFMVSHLSPFTAAYDKPVASIGSTAYYNLQDALDVGGEVNLLRDVKIDATKTSAEDRLMVKVPTTLNFNDKKLIAPGELEPTSNWAALYIKANTTINADENGGIQCLDKENGECGPYAINVIGGANVTINGGTYYGGGTVAQAQLGTLIVNDGAFECTPFGAPYNYDFLLNCVDSNYKNGTAKIIVNGGSFKTFDPANNKSEGAGTNFVADGKGTVKNGDWYEVISGTFVSTEAELKEALTGSDSTIYLANDINLSEALEIKSTMTINGNNHKLTIPNNNGDRVININDNTNPITLTLKDLDVVGPTSGTYTRGISAYNNKGDLKLILDNCSASANYYALNIASKNSNVEVIVKNGTYAAGWCAFQTWTSGTKATFENCKLIGNNDKTYNAEGWNNFATIVVNENTTGVDLTFKNCCIEANQTTGNKQYLMSVRASGAKVTVDGCTFFANGTEIADEDLGSYISVYPAASDLLLTIDGKVIPIS